MRDEGTPSSAEINVPKNAPRVIAGYHRPMHIWVDADACPAVIKEILFRAAERSEIPMTLFANKPLRVPPSRFIRMVTVARGLDVADQEIVRRARQHVHPVGEQALLHLGVIDRLHQLGMEPGEQRLR